MTCEVLASYHKGQRYGRPQWDINARSLVATLATACYMESIQTPLNIPILLQPCTRVSFLSVQHLCCPKWDVLLLCVLNLKMQYRAQNQAFQGHMAFDWQRLLWKGIPENKSGHVQTSSHHLIPKCCYKEYATSILSSFDGLVKLAVHK